MVAKLDKEFEDKMAALAKEKQEKRSDISEKVKVKKERLVQINQKAVKTLENEQKAERERLLDEMWGQSDNEKGEKYDGCINTTSSGRTCQV